MPEVAHAYCDGGLIGTYPTPVAATWAYLHLDGDERPVAAASGVLWPTPNMPVLTNNHAEFFAMAKALRTLPEGWSGKVYSDSQCTIRRFFHGGTNNNVPEDWVRMMRRLMARLGSPEAVLLGGHPNRKELEKGVGKRGLPCSIFNVFCDLECRRVGEAAVAAREGRDYPTSLEDLIYAHLGVELGKAA